jgi:hypothetical protein
MTNLRVAFRNFVNAPKKGFCACHHEICQMKFILIINVTEGVKWKDGSVEVLCQVLLPVNPDISAS